MNDAWTYIGNNPLGAAVLCAAAAFVVATLSALVAALLGGSGRVFNEYQALGRSITESQKASRAQESAYSELHSRVEALKAPPPDQTTPTDQK